jgi:hypothetical protein
VVMRRNVCQVKFGDTRGDCPLGAETSGRGKGKIIWFM